MSIIIAESIIKKRNVLSIIGIIIFCIGALFEAQKAGFIHVEIPNKISNTVGVYYTVTKVTDGDTIHISMDNQDETVRLIGINTPETVDPRRTVECFGIESSDQMKAIAKGKIVRLEYDDTQDMRDAYGRLLAYVYLEDGQMINRKMIAEGYAYEYTYLNPYKYQGEFRQLQNLAQSSKRGLWADETCNGSKSFPK